MRRPATAAMPEGLTIAPASTLTFAVAQDFFREMTDNDVRKEIYNEKENQIEQDMAPFGFMDDGTGGDTFVDSDGTIWSSAASATTVDEYGGMSYMWDYM